MQFIFVKRMRIIVVSLPRLHALSVTEIAKKIVSHENSQGFSQQGCILRPLKSLHLYLSSSRLLFWMIGVNGAFVQTILKLTDCLTC